MATDWGLLIWTLLSSTSPFPSENLPEKADRDQYELLCLNNTRAPVDAFKECHLAQVPSHAVVARSVDGKENLIWELLRKAQVSPPTVPLPAWIWWWGGFLPSFPNFLPLWKIQWPACLGRTPYS